MMEREFHPGTDNEEIAGQPPQNPRKKKNKMKNKRRFSDDQIKLLESIFESETKLEPRKKLQLARELGLQPRQVAIWFQNRRARWKSKQIEQDYRILKDNYDNLASKFESLKKEKQSLMLQLQNLSELLEPHDMNKGSKGGADGSSTGGCSECGDTKCEPEGEAQPKPNLQQSRMEERGLLGLQIEHAVHQPGEDFMSMEEYRNESPVSPEKLYGFDSAGGLFDHSCSSSQWFHFWS